MPKKMGHIDDMTKFLKGYKLSKKIQREKENIYRDITCK